MTGLQSSGFIFNSKEKLDVNAMRANTSLITNGTLRHEDYISWDEKMVAVARNRLTVIQDLNTYGLVDSNYTLGDEIAKYEKLSDMTAGNVDMDGVTPGQRDRLVFTQTGVPIPIFHKDFQLNRRQILSSQNRPGANLPTLGIETATKIVAEDLESMVWNGLPNLVVGGYQIYGLTNHPNRNTVAAAAPWGGGGDTPVADVEGMLAAAYADKFYGPFVLYVSKDKWAFIQGDYSANKGDRTFMERFMAFSDIVAVRPGDGLPDGNVILVQMTTDVIELKVAQELMNFEQPQVNAYQHDFEVMAAMAVAVKSDSSGNCGVVQLTGA